MAADCQRPGPEADKTPRPSSRIIEFDGLRGVAAVVVLVHHCLLTIAPLAAPHVDPNWTASNPWSVDLLMASPLYLLWDGFAAVVLFFVLSGIVLAAPVLRSVRFAWNSYYVRRLVRLYLPIWAAVGLAALVILAHDRSTTTLNSPWVLESVHDSVTLHGLKKDMILLFGHSGMVSPLWSLKWELWFSLLLPVFVLVAVTFRRRVAIGCTGLVVLVMIGSLTAHDWLTYMPVFGIGAVLAANHDVITARTAAWSQSTWAILAACAAVLATSPWSIRWHAVSHTVQRLMVPVCVIGVTFMVVAATRWEPVQRLLGLRVTQWLGTVSFALYLIHEPIVISVAALFGEGRHWISLPLAAALSLALAHAFHLAIEKPSHRLARQLGARVGHA